MIYPQHIKFWYKLLATSVRNTYFCMNLVLEFANKMALRTGGFIWNWNWLIQLLLER
jgi:hypothetical protein